MLKYFFNLGIDLSAPGSLNNTYDTKYTSCVIVISLFWRSKLKMTQTFETLVEYTN